MLLFYSGVQQLAHHVIRRFCPAVLFVVGVWIPAVAAPYFPPTGQWAEASPQSLNINAQRLQQAVDYAIASENKAPKDQAIVQATTFGAREPYDQIIGPMSVRAGANGLIVYQGKVVARWGDVDKVDMTHSITKTFLTTVTGLALQQGLIQNLDDKVAAYMPPGVDLYQSAHNSQIRWEHLLRQSSDWQGTLWGKPDWADRPEGKTPADCAVGRLLRGRQPWQCRHPRASGHGPGARPCPAGIGGYRMARSAASRFRHGPVRS